MPEFVDEYEKLIIYFSNDFAFINLLVKPFQTSVVETVIEFLVILDIVVALALTTLPEPSIFPGTISKLLNIFLLLISLTNISPIGSNPLNTFSTLSCKSFILVGVGNV